MKAFIKTLILLIVLLSISTGIIWVAESNEDFTDTGVGCIDNCLDPAT